MSDAGPSDRWERLASLFQAAVEAATDEERERLLRSARIDHPRLSDEVRGLLEADAGAGAFLDGRPPELEERALDDVGLEAGTRLGAWRVVRRIGRGGMASVYSAERADGRYHQQAALKLLRRGLDTEDLLRRFREEREILARLEHPHIARLLDGGMAPDGRPFLVMELVEGLPIDEYCAEHGLSLTERLRLFVSVCEAVAYAHGQLVVHRDLKPSNILVTPDGIPRLLDFGIAKLLGERGLASASTLTSLGVRILSPAYASPEQFRAEAVTTATDVYSLGLVLYELLTGTNPQAARWEDTDDSAGAAEERPYAPPSRGAGGDPGGAPPGRPERLRRRLRGDLDTIVLRAIHPEPDRRYGSASALAEDIGRHLGGRPIAARGDSWRYRSAKFVGRHRWPVAAALALLAMLAAYVVTLRVHAAELRAQRDRAHRQAERAEKVTEFLRGVFTLADPNEARGQTVTARELLDRGATRLRGELADEPGIRADMLGAIGGIDADLAQFGPGRALLEEALALRDSLGEGPSQELFRELADLGEIVGRTDPDSALALRRRELRVAETLQGPRGRDVGVALTDLASSLTLRGDSVRTRRSHALAERAVGILREHPEARTELADALAVSAYGSAPPRSVRRLQEALEIRRDVLGPDHTTVAATQNDLALAVQRSDPDLADSLMRRAAETYGRVLGRDHDETLTILDNLAGLRRDRGDYAAAEPLYREVLRTRRRLYPDARLPLAYPLYGLGWVLAEEGRVGEAEPLLRRVVAILRDEDVHDVRLDLARNALGRCLALAGRYDEAEPLLVSSWESARRRPGLDRADRRLFLRRLVALYGAWGRPEEADRYRRLMAGAAGPADSASAAAAGAA